jgi:hypothetical protein
VFSVASCLAVAVARAFRRILATECTDGLRQHVDESRRDDPDAGCTESATDKNRDESHSESAVERGRPIDERAPLVTATIPIG